MYSRITNLRSLNNIIHNHIIPWISVVLIANELIANLSTCYLSMILIIQSHKINYLQFGKVSRALVRTNWNYRALNWLKKALKKHCTQKFRAGINQLSRKQKRRQENSQRNDSSNNNNKYLYETSFFLHLPNSNGRHVAPPCLPCCNSTVPAVPVPVDVPDAGPQSSAHHRRVCAVCVSCVCVCRVSVRWGLLKFIFDATSCNNA